MTPHRAPHRAPLRVAPWTVGNVVRQAVRSMARRPDIELVGAYTRSPDKHGVDLGHLCGLDTPLGVAATTDADELLALGLDCVFYAPLHIDVDELSRLLRAGVNVVTTAELLTGTNLGPVHQAALQQAAIDGDASLFGSGMNPGYAQLLAAVASNISDGVTQVTVSESVDVGLFVADANFTAMGWGRPRNDPGHADDVRAGTLVFAEAVEMLGRLLGVQLDDVRCDVEFTYATEDIELPGMTIEQDHVAGMDVHWNGVINGSDVVRVRQRWLASTLVEPPWSVEHGYHIEVVGDPSVLVKLEIWPTTEDLADLNAATMHNIGMRITAVPVVNAIPHVCAAPSGIVTYADLPAFGAQLARG